MIDWVFLLMASLKSAFRLASIRVGTQSDNRSAFSSAATNSAAFVRTVGSSRSDYLSARSGCRCRSASHP